MAKNLFGAGSHYPFLAAAVARTSGAVLELGCGDFSTPMLHHMCKGRYLVTCETDPNWMSQFAHYASDSHLFLQIGSGEQSMDPKDRAKEWLQCGIIDHLKWDVGFIDHNPGEYRTQEVMRLKGHCKYIVCHDTEELFIPGHASGYNWKSVVDQFKYVVHAKEYMPYTMILSDEEPFQL